MNEKYFIKQKCIEPTCETIIKIPKYSQTHTGRCRKCSIKRYRDRNMTRSVDQAMMKKNRRG